MSIFAGTGATHRLCQDHEWITKIILITNLQGACESSFRLSAATGMGGSVGMSLLEYTTVGSSQEATSEISFFSVVCLSGDQEGKEATVAISGLVTRTRIY